MRRFTSNPSTRKLVLLNPSQVHLQGESSNNPGIARSRTSAERAASLEFIRKLLRLGNPAKQKEPDQARGAAPVQSQEEQDSTRARMEAEMEGQRERREAGHTDQ